jgi:hypothetical protein
MRTVTSIVGSCGADCFNGVRSSMVFQIGLSDHDMLNVGSELRRYVCNRGCLVPPKLEYAGKTAQSSPAKANTTCIPHE